MITLTIVEDNPSYQKTLLDIIDLAADMTCLGSFEATKPCLKALKNGTMETPDILLLDLNLPGENGLKMLPLLRKETPETDIIILTQNSKFQTALEALHLGASGYLLKGATVKKIRDVIREVAEGGNYIDSKLSRVVLATLCGSGKQQENPLSPRETEVLELLSLGLQKKELAGKMGISLHTIDYHVRNIYKKLKSPNLAAAVAKALRKKII